MSKNDFSPAEFNSRLSRVQEELVKQQLDWLLVYNPVSILWLTGSEAKSFQGFQCLIISATSSTLTMISRESERAELEADTRIDHLITWGGSEPSDPMDKFAQVANTLSLNGAKVGMEVPAYYLHPLHYKQTHKILDQCSLGDCTNLINDLKLVKSEVELAYIRQAARINDLAMQDLKNQLEIGKSELQLAGIVYQSLLSRNSGIAASTINLVTGERCAFSHGGPTERTLANGDFGNVEFGATVKKYTSTIGRQFVMGKSTARQRELMSVAQEAMDACIEKMRPGTLAQDAHIAAKEVIAKAGLDEYRIHTTGYGLAPGFAPSWGEPVNMFGGNKYVLQAGMVLSVEPPIFIAYEGTGVRLIDNILITDTGPEILTGYPRDLIVVAA
jgi:Xaa-Pro dipeptidase